MQSMGPAGLFIPWRKALKYGIYSVLIILCFLTGLLGNIWGIVTGRGYYVPYHSSIFAFVVTKDNIGSGEWWLYGRDKRFFYGRDEEAGYLYIPRNNTCKGFDPEDWKTWCPEETRRGYDGWEL